MKDLVYGFAFALAAALIILALAVFNTWTGEMMMMITRSASLACLVLPALGIVVAVVIVVQRAVDHHYDTKEAEQNARLQERTNVSATHAVQVLQVAKHEQDLSNRQARGDTELLRAARLLASLQAPQIGAPGDGGPVSNPWLLGYDDDDDGEDNRAPLRL